MLAVICRTILVTHALTCGVPMPAEEAIKTIQDTAYVSNDGTIDMGLIVNNAADDLSAPFVMAADDPWLKKSVR